MYYVDIHTVPGVVALRHSTSGKIVASSRTIHGLKLRVSEEIAKDNTTFSRSPMFDEQGFPTYIKDWVK